MIYIIDHQDSFTWNVVHQFSKFDEVYCSNFFESEVEKLINNKKTKNENKMAENFSSCLGALKLIQNGWETEAVPESPDKHSQKKGFLARIFSNLK